jgi:hypothetical protein
MRLIIHPVLFAGALACCSLGAFASESNNHCNVVFNSNIQLENKILAVTIDNDTRLIINQNRILYVNDVALDLNIEQKRWVNNYYDGINQAIPQAAAIATDAVALASTALNEVFNELLGSDNIALKDLSDKLRHLDQQIQYNFYADNGDIRLHSESFENGEFFGEQWEAQFEESIQDLVADSMGHLMLAIGKQLIFSGGDMREFEQKMALFGEQMEQMEQKVEYQAEALEEKAETLCAILTQVDTAENHLQMNIKQLANLDVIQIGEQYNTM